MRNQARPSTHTNVESLTAGVGAGVGAFVGAGVGGFVGRGVGCR